MPLGRTPREALLHTVELARLNDRLDFTRFWVSEHHNTRALAGSLPDAALARAHQPAPRAVFYSLQLPQDSTASFKLATLRPDASTDNATDEVYPDQYSGQMVGAQTYERRNLGQRVRGLFKPVHTGSIWGWPGKVVSLVAYLLGFTFPSRAPLCG
ncbi:PepSY-associated TM helix domain-containing protein [Hymenobacter lapidiphilus]|uniref:LLM class flavin-dependent oxidoreductase n=1 Tax=Hymenobacter lapidiphilus TaxID=2608003 RepID=A0A7Y7PS46_9BACT|nr:PepSY-associated TM helix domain-containing protein [Hymenobacter lapidiphilus]NVO32687.1 hypothetical protein [Hymenobacter lapidiphilus]